MVGGVVSTTRTGRFIAVPDALKAPPDADETDPGWLTGDEEDVVCGGVAREPIKAESFAAATPQLPFTLHLSVSLQVNSAGAQGSITDREREAVTDSPFSGPVAM